MDWKELLDAFVKACLFLIGIAIPIALFFVALSFGPIGIIVYFAVLLLVVLTGLIYTGEI